VAFIGSLFVFVRSGSGKFYWSAPLDGRTVDALDFATAEREGDQLLDLATVGDNLLLLGQDSTELWEHTGETDLPFTRFEQVAPDRGIHSTGAKCKADNTVFAVGNNCSVYRWGEVWERVSDHGIEERLIAASTINLLRSSSRATSSLRSARIPKPCFWTWRPRNGASSRPTRATG
jgi:hypothetical protein